MFGGQCRGVAPTAPVCEIKNDTHPPTLTPMTPVKQEMKQEEEEMDVEIKTEVVNKPIMEKLIHISLGGKQ